MADLQQLLSLSFTTHPGLFNSSPGRKEIERNEPKWLFVFLLIIERLNLWFQNLLAVWNERTSKAGSVRNYNVHLKYTLVCNTIRRVTQEISYGNKRKRFFLNWKKTQIETKKTPTRYQLIENFTLWYPELEQKHTCYIYPCSGFLSMSPCWAEKSWIFMNGTHRQFISLE